VENEEWRMDFEGEIVFLTEKCYFCSGELKDSQKTVIINSYN